MNWLIWPLPLSVPHPGDALRRLVGLHPLAGHAPAAAAWCRRGRGRGWCRTRRCRAELAVAQEV